MTPAIDESLLETVNVRSKSNKKKHKKKKNVVQKHLRLCCRFYFRRFNTIFIESPVQGSCVLRLIIWNQRGNVFVNV